MKPRPLCSSAAARAVGLLVVCAVPEEADDPERRRRRELERLTRLDADAARGRPGRASGRLRRGKRVDSERAQREPELEGSPSSGSAECRGRRSSPHRPPPRVAQIVRMHLERAPQPATRRARAGSRTSRAGRATCAGRGSPNRRARCPSEPRARGSVNTAKPPYAAVDVEPHAVLAANGRELGRAYRPLRCSWRRRSPQRGAASRPAAPGRPRSRQ